MSTDAGSGETSRKKRRKKKPPKLPETVGKYVITRLVGEGGMGRVYRGIDPDTRQVVAVKTILEARLSSASALPRFLREMQILAGLDHPGVVKILDRGICPEGHFLVMEYVEGRPLDKVIRKGPRPARQATFRLLKELAEALAYMHERGVMHRDLKPGNILMREDGGITLVDFGLSRFLDGGATVTGEGRVIGSPHYLPPEQWRGEKPDHRADVYQLGILAIELLTGKVPFSGTDLRAIMDSCLNYGISTKLLNSLGLEGDVARFLRRCTQRRAERRYQAMADLVEDLDCLMDGRPLPERPESSSNALEASRIGPENEEDVDQDAPTNLENPATDPRNAVSVHRPRKQKRARLGSSRRSEKPARREPDRPPSRPLRRQSRRTRVDSRSEISPKARSSMVFAALACIFLSAGALWVLTRPPPPPPPPRIVAGPTILDDVAAATITWETDRPCLGALEVRGGGELKTLQDSDGLSRTHQLTLKNLSPGKSYTVRVMGPVGPLSEPYEFTARGVSIAFEPLFTPQGLELHWNSEDPLVLGREVMGRRSRPTGAPSKDGLLVLPGVRPGAGQVTVLAFSPLGSVLPVAWTVPDIGELSEKVEKVLEGLVAAPLLKEVDALLGKGATYDAGEVMRRRFGKLASPFRPARILSQASLVLDDSRLPIDRRMMVLDSLGKLLRVRQLLRIQGSDSLPNLELAQGTVFRWGAAPGSPPRARLLAGHVPPPSPLVATHGGEGGGAGDDTLRWELRMAEGATGRVVTLLVHCIRMSPSFYLEAHLGGAPPLNLFTTERIQRMENLDGQDGWTTLYHSFDAELLGRGGALELRLRSLVPSLAGRAVSIQKVEIVDGLYQPEAKKR